MQELDDNTLTRIGEIICDTNGPHHRQYWQLPKFFDVAGWDDVPDYDGESRLGWTLDLLRERRGDFAAIEKVICRLASPFEHMDCEDAPQVAAQLNEVLVYEGLQVVYRGARPALVERDPAMRSPAAPAPPVLTSEIGDIVGDTPLAVRLRARLDEARTCREYGAMLASVILLGSVMEGVLLEFVKQHAEKACRCRAAPRDKQGNVRPITSWRLTDLINVAHSCGWIQQDVKSWATALREYRNMVHPEAELRIGAPPDDDTVNLSWYTVVATLNDLGNCSP
ncbi:hypothetical protein amrb99_59240 [Actinomadura sp. RB99]|uniref:hypothetical protein n=1 Tax=Actinomadura sp. RB99 TaxID=2691577 RepID=UPI001681CEBE|nr:hypothetical protein [Actinomadura sp. RB99]MBD2896971.1 hypothetical protein [Actinomadura sp. RB99]